VDQFAYLDSILPSLCLINDENQNCIPPATAAFGRLGGRVFLNRNMSIKTKVAVHSVISISTLLHGSEVWTLYRNPDHAESKPP